MTTLRHMTLRLSGRVVNIPSVIYFVMDDGTIEAVAFNDVDATYRNNRTIIRFGNPQPKHLKPWKIDTILNPLEGTEQYLDVQFTTDKYYVAFTDEKIDAMNREQQYYRSFK